AVPAPRIARLTDEHVKSIINSAHEMNLHSVALVQALQTDCKLRQKDCIGEWIPEESGTEESDVTHRGEKWIRGLRWEELDKQTLTLRHVTSKNLKPVAINLKGCSRVLSELDRIEHLPTSGPMIISDLSGLPWRTVEFRRYWRKIARAAGVPDNVR